MRFRHDRLLIRGGCVQTAGVVFPARPAVAYCTIQVPLSAVMMRGMEPRAQAFPATIYSDTLYSEQFPDPNARAKPPRADFLTAASFNRLLHSDPPSQWASNRYQQARRLTGTVYVAVQAIMDLAGGSSVTLLRRVRKVANKTTFGPGDTVAKSTPLSQQRGRDEDYVPFEDYDHPLARMTRTPNPNESMGEWMAKVIMQNQLHGIGPVWAVGSESRPDRPVELWCLRAPFMYPLYQYTPQYPNGAWRINPYRSPGWAGVLPSGMGSAGAVIPAEDVKRFMNPHPLIDFDGYGAVEAGAVQLDTHDSVDVSRKSAMERGLNLDTVIIAPGMGDPQVQTMKDGLEARHMGPERARRVAILAPPPDNGPGQKFAIEQLGNSPKDMDYPEGWEQSLTSVLALFGVPKIVACLGESGSYAEGYAAWQQFHGRQENYLARFATWYDRSFCDPWEEYTDQFCLRITPKPIDDKDLAEKKHSRQCQNGTVTLDESRAKDDLPPWPDPEIGRMLLPVALAKLQQDAMPQPQPGALPVDTGGEDAAEGNPDDDGQDVPDEMLAAALEEIGVPGDGAVAKAGQYDESKHRRDHGKFSSTQGAGKTDASLAAAQSQEYQRLRDAGHSHADAHAASQEIRPGSAPGQSRPTPPPIPQRAAQVSQRAKASPAVKEQLSRAHEWADRMAEQHADRVAAHLGIDRASAKHVLASTIKMLCERALRGEGDEQSAKFTGRAGQKLNIGIKKKQIPGGGPSASGPPRPSNPQGAGSLAPRKAMSSLVGSEGGALVPAAAGRMQRKRKRGLRGFLRAEVKALRG